MRVFARFDNLNLQVPVRLGEFVGEGADGEIFSLLEDNSKVIKLSILYGNSEVEKEYRKIHKSLRYLTHTHTEPYVRVYDHSFLGHFSEKIVGGARDFILFYTIMEKLEKISEDERKIFHSILSHEDKRIIKNFSTAQIEDMLHGMSLGLEFEHDKVILFCEQIKRSSLKHLDIHVRNIMKSSDGNFKLIDLDRVELEN